MKIIRKKIYGITQRICHLGIGFFTIVLIMSAYSANYFYEYGLIRKSLWISHVFAGFSLTFFLVLRIIWGFLGPHHARFSSMWKFQEWRKILKGKTNSIKWNWGHHPVASLIYFIFYFNILLLCISGIILAAIEHNLGPLAQNLYDQLNYSVELKDIHEALSLSITLFVAAHLSALLFHEVKDKVPVVQSMFSGYQYKEESGEDKNENDNNT
ncbi:MAG: cytochrome b/b6 domain-containing protein [Bacteriovoracaceae bacterium]|nr:cytochrome b/b6 domain-containing protein [Bacteriovoracaceae bacterium]